MQNLVCEFNKKMSCHKKVMPVSARLLDINSELGELHKEYLKNSKYGTENFCVTEDYQMEFGDLMYSILSLANETNINAKECLQKALNKYEERIKNKNNMGNI